MAKTKESSIEEIKKAVDWFQSLGYIHELTCGNDSRHKPLVVAIEGEKAVLRCPDCDYRQEKIPDVVLEMYRKR